MYILCAAKHLIREHQHSLQAELAVAEVEKICRGGALATRGLRMRSCASCSGRTRVLHSTSLKDLKRRGAREKREIDWL